MVLYAIFVVISVISLVISVISDNRRTPIKVVKKKQFNAPFQCKNDLTRWFLFTSYQGMWLQYRLSTEQGQLLI